jgi:hypothetical protein
MTELTTILQLLIQLSPALGGVLGIVVTALICLKKISTFLTDAKNSTELKDLLGALKQEHEDNQQLRAMNEKLTAELKRIKPLGYTDDNKN